MSNELSTESWFALQVRTRWERSTATMLQGKGYDAFLPMYKSRRRWSGGVKEVLAPLFAGYVFCRFDVSKRLPILVTPGVIGVVGRGRTPAPVEHSEISALRALVSSGLRAQPWPFLEVGQRVRIDDNSLRGMEGILVGFKGSHRIVISVSLLRRSVALEIEKVRVTPLHPTRAEISGSSSLQPLLDGALA